jgi:NAD-dependent deacetylase
VVADAASLAQGARAIAGAARIAVLTGAGISAESGVPTFRDAQTGLWANFRPEDLATPEAFIANPQRVWEWYAWRRQQLDSVAPNAGHLALAELQRRCPRFTLITQNVDGLHAQAGSEDVLECTAIFGAANVLPRTWSSTPGRERRGAAALPCLRAWLRPDVVWFGEMLPRSTYEAALVATEDCEVFLSIGTSTVVEPAASLPFLALERGAAVIEINPQPTPLSASASIVLRGPAARVLPELVRAAWPGASSDS